MYSDCKLFQSSEDTGSTEAQQNATPTESALAWIGRGSATYDDANQIATWAGTSFTYDDNGNLTSDGSKSYSWNARNELTGSGGGGSASFAYDAAGRRRSRTVGSTTTQFLYDGLNPVQELASGTPTANLLTGLGIDEYFTRTDAVGVRNLLTDALGSTIAGGRLGPGPDRVHLRAVWVRDDELTRTLGRQPSARTTSPGYRPSPPAVVQTSRVAGLVRK